MRFLIISIFFILVSCATRSKVSDDYANVIRTEGPASSKKTTVFFLIDGLSTQALDDALAHHRLLNWERFFLGKGQSVHRAHAVFPSLTFPNLSSLLHQQPVHLTGAIGNSIVDRGRVLRFESGFDREQFGETMRGQTLFRRLAEKGLRSVSLDYGLGVTATVEADLLDLKSGLALETKDYAYLDQKRLDALKLLLEENEPANWPSFIFIHVIGLDFANHRYGARSLESGEVLADLDLRMHDVLDLLSRSEKSGHSVTTMLSADHGFAPTIAHRFSIEPFVKRAGGDLRVFNEGRMAAIYAPKEPSEKELVRLTSYFLKIPGVDAVASRRGNQVRIVSRSANAFFDYQPSLNCPRQSVGISVNGAAGACSHALPSVARDLFGPFFIENLASYFQAQKHPDLVLLPERTSAFLENEVGFHGGITPEEVFVPLLLRNARLVTDSTVPAIWEVLDFL